MSSYFEVWDKENSIQITDSSNTYQVVRSGAVSGADYNNGVWHGFVLNDNESFATFKVDSGNLVISPMYICSGKRVQYVSSSGTDIKYRVFGNSKNVSPSIHCTGIEIYDSSGNVVYSSNLDVLNYKMYKTIVADSGIFNKTGRDSPYLKAQSNMMETSKNWWSSFSYSGNDPYIMSYTVPWVVTGTVDKRISAPFQGRKEYGVHFLTGYTFSNSHTFSTATHTTLSYATMSSLTGFGDLHQLGKIIKTAGTSQDWNGHSYVTEGVFCINYMFHIFDSN